MPLCPCTNGVARQRGPSVFQRRLLKLSKPISGLVDVDTQRSCVQANAKLLRAPDDAAQPVVLCDLSNSRWWSILYSNTPFAAVAGVPPEALVDNSFWKLFRPANNEAKVQYSDITDLKTTEGCFLLYILCFL